MAVVVYVLAGVGAVSILLALTYLAVSFSVRNDLRERSDRVERIARREADRVGYRDWEDLDRIYSAIDVVVQHVRQGGTGSYRPTRKGNVFP